MLLVSAVTHAVFVFLHFRFVDGEGREQRDVWYILPLSTGWSPPFPPWIVTSAPCCRSTYMISLRMCATVYLHARCSSHTQPGSFVLLVVLCWSLRTVHEPFVLRQFSCGLGSNSTSYEHTRPPRHGSVSVLGNAC